MRSGAALGRVIPLLCTLLALLVPGLAVAASDFLSVSYSKKSQIRTSMRWMQHQPKLIRGADLTALEIQGSAHTPGTAPNLDNPPSSPEAFTSLQLPYSGVGKLFFTKKGGKIGTCSAAFAGASDLIVTAAHCALAMDGEWNNDFLFIRSYGAENQEAYGIGCVATPRQWGELTDNKALQYDYAFLKAIRVSGVGSLGITNALPPAKVLLVGYADKYFNGRKLIRMQAPTFMSEPGQIGTSDNPLGSGSSGMPWLGRSTVHSVTSHFYAGRADVMWGPLFTAQTMQLMRYVRNGCELTASGGTGG